MCPKALKESVFVFYNKQPFQRLALLTKQVMSKHYAKQGGLLKLAHKEI